MKRWHWYVLAAVAGVIFALAMAGRLEGFFLALAGGGLLAGRKMSDSRAKTNEASEAIRRSLDRLERERKNYEEEVERIEKDHKHRTVDDLVSRANERERHRGTTIR